MSCFLTSTELDCGLESSSFFIGINHFSMKSVMSCTAEHNQRVLNIQNQIFQFIQTEGMVNLQGQ